MSLPTTNHVISDVKLQVTRMIAFGEEGIAQLFCQKLIDGNRHTVSPFDNVPNLASTVWKNGVGVTVRLLVTPKPFD